MKNIFNDFEQEMISLASKLNTLFVDSSAVYNSYFKTSATSDITGVANGTDAVTVASKLTKTTYLAGITFVEDIEDFFTNTAVTTTDYQATAMKIFYGETERGSVLSYAVESLGDRMKEAMTNALDIMYKADYLVNLYFDEQVDAMVTSLSNQKILPGTNITKYHLVSMVTLLQQYQNMLKNSAVSTGDYLATVNLWLGQIS